MSDHDDRQYVLMSEKITAFENNHLKLKQLIADLDGLLNALQNAQAVWKASFYKEWAILEDVYASALNENMSELSFDYGALVDKAIGNIKQLLKFTCS